MTGSKKHYVVFCTKCYFQRLETDSKTEANLWATSHGNLYGHEVSINVYEKQSTKKVKPAEVPKL